VAILGRFNLTKDVEEFVTDTTYNVIKPNIGVPIKAWIKGAPSKTPRTSSF